MNSKSSKPYNYSRTLSYDLAVSRSKKKQKSSKQVNYTLSNPDKITFEFLKSYLWSAADILRGSLDPSDYTGDQICQICWKTDDGTYVSCDPPRTKGRPDSSTIAPPPSGVAPPPSTQTCPDNTAIDANGNCAPLTQGPTDQGTTLPPTNDNTHTKHHKGSNLGQGQLEGSLVNGDNNPSPSTSTGDNNDKPSKHQGVDRQN